MLLNKDIRECVYENAESNEIDQFLYTITMDTVKYKDAYIKKISEHLSSEWTFDRLGYVEQAILLMACCENRPGDRAPSRSWSMKRSLWPRNTAMSRLTG